MFAQENERRRKIDDRAMRRYIATNEALLYPDQNSQIYTGGRRRADVTHLIANNDAAAEVKVEISCGLQEHARIGLAPGVIRAIGTDAIRWMIRAVVDTLNGGTFRSKAVAHPPSQVLIVAFCEVATADPGLIGDHDDWPLNVLRPKPRQFENTWKELEPVHGMHVTVVDVDHAVTVKKEGTARYVPRCADAFVHQIRRCPAKEYSKPVVFNKLDKLFQLD
jgi:hypothetical protein